MRELFCTQVIAWAQFSKESFLWHPKAGRKVVFVPLGTLTLLSSELPGKGGLCFHQLQREPMNSV